MQKQFLLAGEEATEAFAGQIAQHCFGGLVIYLQGDLGAGKTCFSRGFIHALGHQGRVKSPTYTLVEPYDVGNLRIFHFDLYRLSDPEELEYIGIRDYFAADTICLIEWPDKGAQLLASADLEISIEIKPDSRSFVVKANTQKGQQVISKL